MALGIDVVADVFADVVADVAAAAAAAAATHQSGRGMLGQTKLLASGLGGTSTSRASCL